MVDQGPPSPWRPRDGSVKCMDEITASSGSLRLHGVRVLIVDDDDGIRFAVRMLLEQSGAIVTDAPSAEDGARIAPPGAPGRPSLGPDDAHVRRVLAHPSGAPGCRPKGAGRRPRPP
jgi:hypothetical protein